MSNLIGGGRKTLKDKKKGKRRQIWLGRKIYSKF
jgi:hypothetical protein